MALVTLPINSKTYKNADDVEISTLGADLQDGFLNELKHTVKRPGLSSNITLGTGKAIDGAFYWDNLNARIFVSNGQIFKVPDGSTTPTDITGDKLTVGVKVIFAEIISSGTKYLFMATGGQMIFTDGTTNTAFVSDADAPILVSHVATNNGRMLANKTGTDTWYYSDAGDPFTWQGIASSFDAEVAPDFIQALHANNGEIALFGEETVEFWYDQGVPNDPFARISGATLQIGCEAPYSVMFANNSYYFMTDERRIIKLTGRQAQFIDTPFAKEFQNLTTVTDAIGDNIIIDGRGFYLLTFPSDKKSFMYDYVNDIWSTWGFFNTGIGSYEHFLGVHSIWSKADNLHLIGSRIDDSVYALDMDNYFDVASTNPIRFRKRTGNIDHGSNKRKVSEAIYLKIKRGKPAGSTVEDPVLEMRIRDNNSSQWETGATVDLGDVGETEATIELRPMGAYNTRQYEFMVSDNVPFTIVDVQEEVREVR